MGLNLRPLLDMTPEQRAERDADNIAFARALGAEHKARRDASIMAARKATGAKKREISRREQERDRTDRGARGSFTPW